MLTTNQIFHSESAVYNNSVCIFMSIYIPKKVPDQDYYVIGDFTMATTDGAIEDFTTATSDDAIGLNSSCVVVVVL